MTNEQIFQDYKAAWMEKEAIDNSRRDAEGPWAQDEDDNYLAPKAERDAAKARMIELGHLMSRLMTQIEAMPVTEEKKELAKKYLR